jgi:hypothetical protein
MNPENVYTLGQEECPVRESAEFPVVAGADGGGKPLTGWDNIVLVALVGGIGAAALWYFDVI